MLQLSAPSYQAAVNKTEQLPHGSWGIVRIPNDSRVMAFSVCGDEVIRYSYSAANFDKNYNNGMARMLKNHAAKPPISAELKKKTLTQAYNNINDSIDRPDNAVDSSATPGSPTGEDI